jgi:hypothetical protein
MAAQQMNALVVHADDPLDNRIKIGTHGRSQLRILVDAQPAPIYTVRGFKLDRDHWPVRGMHLPVTIDPSDPSRFEVDWARVPSIEQRVAANDPTLADPVGTQRRTMEKLIASGVAGPGADAAGPDVRGVVVAAQAAAFAAGPSEGMPDHFAESMERAATEPAPPGKARAVVLIAASEATLRTEDDGSSSGRYYRDRHGKHDAVLAVNIPGRPPYAVFKHKFKHPRGKSSATGAGLPALVSSSDPADVEILWDELMSVKDQARQTAAEAMQATQSRMAEATAQMAGAFQPGGPVPPRATAQPPAAPPVMPPAATPPVFPGTPPSPGVAPMPPGVPQMPANMQAMMAQNARAALAMVQDPAARAMLIAQYRAAGIEIDDGPGTPPR